MLKLLFACLKRRLLESKSLGLTFRQGHLQRSVERLSRRWLVVKFLNCTMSLFHRGQAYKGTAPLGSLIDHEDLLHFTDTFEQTSEVLLRHLMRQPADKELYATGLLFIL